MELWQTILLAVAAFWLGACPFSLWIGRWFLGKDIRDYGDGNPGTANVFRAGGRKLGYLAALSDVAKGVPFVVLAHSFLELPDGVVAAIALCPILGHAFSPILKGRGGKAIAVTFGVLLALPQREMLILFLSFSFLGFLFIESDAWTIIFGATGALAFLAVTRGGSWESLLMLCILVILAVKHFEDLHTIPSAKGRLVRWLQTMVRGT